MRAGLGSPRRSTTTPRFLPLVGTSVLQLEGDVPRLKIWGSGDDKHATHVAPWAIMG
jgi:hypothetical protein